MQRTDRDISSSANIGPDYEWCLYGPVEYLKTEVRGSVRGPIDMYTWQRLVASYHSISVIAGDSTASTVHNFALLLSVPSLFAQQTVGATLKFTVPLYYSFNSSTAAPFSLMTSIQWYNQLIVLTFRYRTTCKKSQEWCSCRRCFNSISVCEPLRYRLGTTPSGRTTTVQRTGTVRSGPVFQFSDLTGPYENIRSD